MNINNSVDCYYNISEYGTITTDEDGVQIATFKLTSTSNLISVTNIKVTGNVEFTIVDSKDTNVDGSEGDDEDGDIEVQNIDAETEVNEVMIEQEAVSEEESAEGE